MTTIQLTHGRLCAGDNDVEMIETLKSGGSGLHSRKRKAQTGKRRRLGTFPTLEAAKRHEHQAQFFKRH